MNRALNRLSSLLLLLMGIIPTVHLVMVSFSLSADDRLPYMLFLACLFCWLVFGFKKLSLPGAGLCAAMVLLFLRGRGQLLLIQAQDAADKMAGAYCERFIAQGYGFLNLTDSHTELLFLLGLGLGILVSLGLNAKEERVVLSLAPIAPVVLLCLLVYGQIPAWIMLCLSAFAFMLLCTGRYFSLEGNSGRAFFCLMLPVALALSLLVLWKGPDSYVAQERDLSLVESLQELLQDLTAKLEIQPDSLTDLSQGLSQDQEGIWAGSGGQLDASRPIDSDRLDQLLLELRAPETGRIYLRLCSYGDYTGTGWSTARDYPGGQALAFASYAVQATGSQEQELDITLGSASDRRLYVPYYSLESYSGDSYVPGQGDSYTLSYYSYQGSIRSLSLPQELGDQELSYRQFVYSAYLGLPEDTAHALQEIAQAAGAIGGDGYETIALVADLVRQQCYYDINTQPYPTEDYAVYFFREAQEGYCVHFATAAVAMYRALGIPARAVSGLAVDAVAGETVPVYRQAEHAWAEVYVDGVGWLPVEVTPAGDMGGLGENESSPSPLPSPSQEPQGEEDAPQQEAASSPSPQPSSQPEIDEAEPISPIVWIALSLLLFLGALVGGWQLRRRVWERRLSKDGREGALHIWRRARQICSFGADMPEAIQKAAQRAGYGPGDMEPGQVEAARAKLLNLREEVYASLPWYKKPIFRFLRGL